MKKTSFLCFAAVVMSSMSAQSQTSGANSQSTSARAAQGRPANQVAASGATLNRPGLTNQNQFGFGSNGLVLSNRFGFRTNRFGFTNEFSGRTNRFGETNQIGSSSNTFQFTNQF